MFEKVNPSHPDKIADRIAGVLVDLAYVMQKNPRIAVEVLLGHGVCHIITETSVSIPVKDMAKKGNSKLCKFSVCSAHFRQSKFFPFNFTKENTNHRDTSYQSKHNHR